MMRSAVRSRLAPPAFARFASFGWASCSVPYRSEASEGCLVVVHLGEDGLSLKIPQSNLTNDLARARARNPSYVCERNASLFCGFRHDRQRHALEPAIDKILQPGALRHVMHRATFEVKVTRLRAGQIHLSTRGPAMHHRVGHVGMKLKTERVPRPERLNREVIALRE